ncbi:MAG: HNH endonuclease [Planctomycetes bacterium]|nr:HNH endonuclease [Planctomycetota bacterium]
MRKPVLLPAETALRKRCRRIFNDQRRRARADGVTLSYDLDELLKLARAALVYGYCRLPLTLALLRFDHAKPTARGGAYALDNLRACCDRCNRLKGKLDAGEFALLLALLQRLHPAAGEDVARRLLTGGVRYRRR